MAEKKPIITIQVDAKEFEQFKREFEDFKKSTNVKAKVSGSASGGVGGGARAARGGEDSIFAGFQGYTLTRDIEKLTDQIFHLTKSITSFGLRVATGSLLGVGALSYSAFSRYREATGFGVTPGQLSAFSAYYSPLVSGPDVLSKVANARNDLSMRPYLARLGIGQNELSSQSNDQIAASIVERAATLWKNGPQTTQFAEAMGLSQFFSMEDLRRIGQMSPEQLRRMRGQMNAAEPQLNFSPEIAQKWNDLTVQLRKAGVQIDTVLIKDLSNLARPLGHLSDVIVTTLDHFLNDADMPQAIDNLGHGIEWVAKEIASGDFQQGVTSFAHNVVDAAKGLAEFLKWINNFLGIGQKPTDAVVSHNSEPMFQFDDYGKYLREAREHDEMHAIAGAPNYKSHLATVMGLEKKYNLPSGSLFGVWGAESGFSRVTTPSSAGAMGAFQLMPDNYRKAGIDPNDFNASAEEAAKELSGYYRAFGGESLAFASYNWGPGNVDKDLANNGGNVVYSPTSKVNAYIRKVMGYQAQAQEQYNATLGAAAGGGQSSAPLNRPPRNPNVTMTIHNSTSANVATTAAALSH